MKKIRLVQIISVILFLLYVSLIILKLIWNKNSDNNNLIFSILLAIVSMNLIYKGKILKSTSTLWFGLCLILYAITIIIFELFKYDLSKYYCFFTIIPIFSSLIVLAIFNNLIYIKVIILNVSIAIPIIFYNIFWLTWWWGCIIGVVSIAIGIILSRCLNIGKEKV